MEDSEDDSFVSFQVTTAFGFVIDIGVIRDGLRLGVEAISIF